MTSSTKKLKSKSYQIFSIETRRHSSSSEGLNSSLAQPADELSLETSRMMFQFRGFKVHITFCKFTIVELNADVNGDIFPPILRTPLLQCATACIDTLVNLVCKTFIFATSYQQHKSNIKQLMNRFDELICLIVELN